MTEIKLILLGQPISKDNEKIRNRNNRYFLSPRFKNYENQLRIQAMQQMQGKSLLKGPIKVIIDFYFRDKRRCDLLNAPKSVCDALNGIVWQDDKQIEIASLRAYYAPNSPRVELLVTEI